VKDDPVLPGYILFPTGLEDRFFQELVSETRVAKKRMGMLYYIWDKPDRQANEILDCVIYASAAAIKHGVNFISDQGWKKLEAEFEVRASTAVDVTKLDNPRSLVFKSIASQLAR
jgi:phage terminase large subunit GpA-like protein